MSYDKSKAAHGYSKKGKKIDDYFPSDCWAEIISKLDESELEPVSRVCKDFLFISNKLRQRMRFLVTDFSVVNVLPKLMSRFSSLNEVHLIRDDTSPKRNIALINSAIYEMLRSPCLDLKALTVLCRCNCDYAISQKTVFFESFTQLGAQMKSLNRLTCSICLINNKILEQIGNSFPSLEELFISNACEPQFASTGNVVGNVVDAKFVTDDGVELLTSKLKYLNKIALCGDLTDRSIVSLCSNCPLLKELRLLSFTQISSRGFGYLLQHCPHLISFMPETPRPLVIHKVTAPTFEDLFARARQLQNLGLYIDLDCDRTFASITNAKLPLKELSVSASPFIPSRMSSLLEACPSISSLSILNGFFNDRSLGKIIKDLKNLTSIRLIDCSYLTNSTFVILADECTCLESITMVETRLGKGNFPIKYAINGTIQHIHLEENDFLDDRTLMNIGRLCPNLQHLNLYGCPRVSSKGTTEILKLCEKLRVLTLESFLDAIFFESEIDLNLEVLSIISSEVQDECLEMIGKRCHKLKKLGLVSCSRIYKKGVINVLTNCKELKEICLVDSHNILHHKNAPILKSKPWLRISH